MRHDSDEHDLTDDHPAFDNAEEFDLGDGTADGPDGGPGTGRLSEGDALRLSDEPGRVVTATEHTDLLVWTFG